MFPSNVEIPGMSGDGPFCKSTQSPIRQELTEPHQLLQLYQTVNELMHEYLSKPFCLQAPDEFIEGHECAELFLMVMHREKFLRKLATGFGNDIPTGMLCFHLCIFELNATTCNNIFESFMNWGPKRARKIIKFLIDEDNMLNLAFLACSIYENDYVMEKIITPLKKNSDLLRELLNSINDRLSKSKERGPIRVTRCVSPQCLRRSRLPKLIPQTPCPSFQSFKPLKIPKTTYPTLEQIKLEETKAKNRARAQALLAEANRSKPKLSLKKVETKTVEKCERIDLIDSNKNILKAKSLPEFYKQDRVITVKPTAASILRDAKYVYNKYEKEIHDLQHLTEGACNQFDFEAFQNQIRQEEYEESLREIEIKHLRGLLTHEEAGIAKMKLVENNKIRAEEMKKEKEQLLKELAVWKEEEAAKMLEQVKRVQQIQELVTQAQCKVLEQKQENAKQIEAESKRILQKIAEDRQAELQKKIDMIAEIRALQHLEYTPQFDPTDCKNLGLLCEMSLAELQERLQLLRITIAEELKHRKEKIQLTKTQRESLLADAKRLVDDDRRRSEAKKIPIIVPREADQEILSLREELTQKQMIRKQMSTKIK